AALIGFVRDADRHRVEELVEHRYWRFEEQASSERLEFVIGETRHRLRADDHRRLITITREDLDLFAVLNAVLIAQLIWTGRTVGTDLIHDLRHRVAAGKASGAY